MANVVLRGALDVVQAHGNALSIWRVNLADGGGMEKLANHNFTNQRLSAALEVIRPLAEHDDLTFDALSRTYSFCKSSDRRRSFVRLVIQEIQKHPPRRARARHRVRPGHQHGSERR